MLGKGSLSNRVQVVSLYISVLVVMLCLSSPTTMFGQTAFGSVTGTVVDPSGAIVPGVQVTLTNLDTNVKETTKTNADGIYAFVNVRPGNYGIEAVKSGFKRFVRSPVVVQTQQSYRVDIGMQIGAVTQEVQVTAATPLLQPQTSSLGQVIAGRSVTEMPLNGRNVFNLMSLVPSVVPQGESTGSPTGANPFGWNNYQINGAFGGESAIYVDGTPVTGSGYINMANYFPSQDSVQEFKVITNNLGPEWGRFAGGVMILNTKSGTNKFHGEAYEFLRNKVLNANTFFANEAGISRPPFTQNQFGANAGGPVVIPGVYNGKDKTFWFFGWESFRLRQGITFTDTMPTAAELNGDFSNLRDSSGNLIPIYDPLTVCGEFGNPACATNSSGQPIYTRQPFPNNKIPANRLNTTALKLASLWAQPNIPGQQYTNINNFTTNVSRGGNNNSIISRIDHTISDKQHIFGRYSYWNNLNLAADPLGTGECLFGECTEKYHTNDIVLDDTYTFTPTLISDIHVGFDRMVYDRIPVVPTGVDLTSVGWPASYNDAIPPPLRVIPNPCVVGMSEDLFCNGGVSLGSVIIARTNDWDFTGDITKVHGHHTLKMGAQFMVLQDNYAQTNEATGDLRFNGQWTRSSPFGGSGGFGFADYLLGYMNSIGNSIPALTANQQRYWALYAGDTWQVTNKLTLNLGVRYEQDRPWTERFNRLSLWNLTAANQLTQSTALPAPGELCLVASSCFSSRANRNPDDKQFSPRLGLAYRLTPNTVIRSGYGIFWIPANAYWVSGNLDPVNGAGTPGVTSIDGGITPYSNLSNPFPNGILEPPGRSPTLNSFYLGQGLTTFVPNDPFAYMQQWNFDIQQQLPAGFFIDAAYAASKGTHLAYGGQQMNQLPDKYLAMGTALQTQVANPYFGLVGHGSLANPTVAAGQLLRPYPEYTGVALQRQGSGDSNYNSFQLKVQRHFKGGGTLLAAYTVSKLLSNADTITSWLEGSTGGVGGIQDWNNLNNEYSISSQDVPQRAVISYVMNLPFGHGQKYLSGASGVGGKLVSGWGIDGITTFQSGFPLKLGTAVNLTNSFGGGSRPNVVPGCNAVLSTSATSRLNGWFNTSCFTQPAAFTFGNEPRVDPHLKTQGVNNFDFAMFKSTSFGSGERYSVQFRAEFFNLFNRPQFAAPGGTLGSSSFGVVTSQVNDPRLVQFALKFRF
jgi:Carboxypeptidase regulatory-like domain/TonB dependent receptor-like, beta-barrel